MTYSERAYPDRWNPVPDQCAHCATREDHLRLRRIRRDCARMAPIARREWEALPEMDPVKQAQRHLASLSPERRAQLEAEWQ